MFCKGWTSISANQAEERVALKLPTVPNVDCSAIEVLRLFTERSGLMREVALEEIDFTHRTLQEYLAAHAILREMTLRELVDRGATDDRWRELVVLCAGGDKSRNGRALVKELLDSGDRDPSQRSALHVLAISCYDTALELDPVTQRRLKDSLSSLIPPKTHEAVRAIAAAGDTAVPLLHLNPAYAAEHSVSCVRALSLIGTPPRHGGYHDLCGRYPRKCTSRGSASSISFFNPFVRPNSPFTLQPACA